MNLQIQEKHDEIANIGKNPKWVLIGVSKASVNELGTENSEINP